MKLNKYLTASAIVLAVAVVIGLFQNIREHMSTPAPPPPPQAPPPDEEYNVTASQNTWIVLSAPTPGTAIKEILVASYGTPNVDENGVVSENRRCHSSAVGRMRALCVGKKTCTIGASDNNFADPCPGTSKTLGVRYTVGVDPAIAKEKKEEEAKAKVEKDKADKIAAEAKAAADKIEADKAAADKKIADKEAAEKKLADDAKAAAEKKAADDKKALDAKAAEEADQQQKVIMYGGIALGGVVLLVLAFSMTK